MQNYTRNILKIKGNEILISNIVGRKFSFNNTIWRPHYCVDKIFEWNYDNWGVKFDAEFVKVKQIGEIIYIEFYTFEYPPKKWLEKTMYMYPQLEIMLFYVNSTQSSAGQLYGKNNILYHFVIDKQSSYFMDFFK